ncbi:MAG: diacylglycerol kinase family protein [Pseudolysinimonas sp.]
MPNTFQPKRLIVAINPGSAAGGKKAVGPQVLKGLRDMGHDVTELQEKSYQELLTKAREAIATKPDGFVVVGGDGMVNLGANMVAGTKVPLGIISAGTGNDTADRSTFLSTTPLRQSQRWVRHCNTNRGSSTPRSCASLTR